MVVCGGGPSVGVGTLQAFRASSGGRLYRQIMSVRWYPGPPGFDQRGGTTWMSGPQTLHVAVFSSRLYVLKSITWVRCGVLGISRGNMVSPLVAQDHGQRLGLRAVICGRR